MLAGAVPSGRAPRPVGPVTLTCPKLERNVDVTCLPRHVGSKYEIMPCVHDDELACDLQIRIRKRPRLLAFSPRHDMP